MKCFTRRTASYHYMNVMVSCVKSPGVGPHASLYPVAPGTLFHETIAVLVLTADTFRVCTALLSTDRERDSERWTR